MLNRDKLNEGDLPENIMVKFDDPDIAKQRSLFDSIRIKAHSVTFEGKKILTSPEECFHLFSVGQLPFTKLKD
jgi:hypothetical protein